MDILKRSTTSLNLTARISIGILLSEAWEMHVVWVIQVNSNLTFAKCPLNLRVQTKQKFLTRYLVLYKMLFCSPSDKYTDNISILMVVRAGTD